MDVPRPAPQPRLDPPPRLMLGPGPSNAYPRVYQAMALHQVGHLDPYFLQSVEELKVMLRYVWQTRNAFTVPVSGTGSAAMEACICNLIEPGDVFLVCVNGYFGERMVDMGGRYGANVVTITRPYGEVFTLAEITAAIETHRPSLLGIVHAETSTGTLQPMDGIADACHANNCMLLLDTVTSIGGIPLFLDRWGVDAAYAGGQKCLGVPPGCSPLTFNDRAMAKLNGRRTKVANWYLDMSMIARYLVPGAGAPRVYHHTAPISMVYALREGLQIVCEEGLEASHARHRANAELLWQGLEGLGLRCLVPLEYRLPSLTTVVVPEGIDAKQVQNWVLQNYNLEIGGGLGSLAGKVWRIGLMGFNSRPENVVMVLGALQRALTHFTPKL
eukprot:gnl/Spiro4/21901_TR10747_c0_g1_i1.p1 gnl/Spiro4/21901_TR10747_c0_g1~~gnl/Spiro4/21901_TR10747_c0_g1_i1.p1  ORF type:complete len:399 (-),score=93.39 gnl/Spiro4/21901_TR10747_c0_g1_i1:90-1247(-)